MPDQINSALIARARVGDPAALGTIYDRFHDEVFRYLFYRLGDRENAEDLTADLFLRVIQALPTYQQRGAPFKAWIFRIAHNLVVDHYRRSNVNAPVDLDLAVLTSDDRPDEVAERDLLSEQLVQALDTLTLEQREVIILRFVVGLQTAEVAEVMKKSESSIKALQRRGLRSLNRTLVKWKISYV